jgi:hypothetical protein
MNLWDALPLYYHMYCHKLYEAVILLTLQLLYYRSWVSRIKYTHVKARTF